MAGFHVFLRLKGIRGVQFKSTRKVGLGLLRSSKRWVKGT